MDRLKDVERRRTPECNPSRNSAGQTALRAAVAAGGLLGAYATLIEPRWLDWHDEEVILPGLAPDLDGIRVFQLSDTHVPRSIPAAFLAKIIESCNAQSPDLVVLTGDLIEAERKGIPSCAALFGRLQARLGVFAILGAHDFRRDRKLMARSLEHHGIRTLCNEAAPVGPVEQPLWIAGLDDNSGFGVPDLRRALAPVPAGAPVVMLMHSPDDVEKAAALGVPLVLAGHTHGGQVCVPFYGPLRTMSRFGRRYARGRKQVGNTVLYTTRGIGTHHHIRFLARPEIVRIRLCCGVR